MKITLLAVSALLSLTGASSAALVYFSGILQGTQEVPPNASPGSGSVLLTIDDTTLNWSLTGNYADLGSAVTAAHIHGPAAVGVNTGVVVALTHSGGTAGTLSGNGTFSTTQFNNLQAELFYVNVHTTNFSAGEVRAQLVPEPSSALIGLASVGLLLIRRTRAGSAVPEFRCV